MRRIIGLALTVSLVASPVAAQATSFDDGTYAVGTGIVSGTYQTVGVDKGCYWARLSGLSGELDDIIANGTPRGPAMVEIATSDVAFETFGCGTWTAVGAPTQTPAGDGEAEFGRFAQAIAVSDMSGALGEYGAHILDPAARDRVERAIATDQAAMLTLDPDPCWMHIFLAWRDFTVLAQASLDVQSTSLAAATFLIDAGGDAMNSVVFDSDAISACWAAAP